MSCCPHIASRDVIQIFLLFFCGICKRWISVGFYLFISKAWFSLAPLSDFLYHHNASAFFFFCNHNNYLYALVVSKILLRVYNHHFNPYYTHTACSPSHSVSLTSSNGGICTTYLSLHPSLSLSLHHHLAYQNILCGIVKFVLVLVQNSLFVLPGRHPSCWGIYPLMP